jgi:hypothetical protein
MCMNYTYHRSDTNLADVKSVYMVQGSNQCSLDDIATPLSQSTAFSAIMQSQI